MFNTPLLQVRFLTLHSDDDDDVVGEHINCSFIRELVEHMHHITMHMQKVIENEIVHVYVSVWCVVHFIQFLCCT